MNLSLHWTLWLLVQRFAMIVYQQQMQDSVLFDAVLHQPVVSVPVVLERIANHITWQDEDEVVQ